MAKNISKGDVRKEDFLVLRQSRDNTVTNVIAPNGLQVGLTDDRFRNPLTVKGGIQVTDEKSYLKAGANITLETDADGQITIATGIDDVAVRRNKQQYVVSSGPYIAGTDILLPSSGLNTIGVTDTDDFIDIYHNNSLLLSGSVAEVTAGTKDYYIKPADSEVVFGFDVLNGDTIISTVISSGSANVAAAGDALSLTNNVYNVNVATAGGIQISSDELSVKLKSGGALGVDSDGMFVDISGQSDLGVGVVTGDYVLVYDSSAGAIKKVSVGNIQGAGAIIDIAGVSNSLTETTLASGDLFAVADVSASDEVKKITIEDFGQYLAAGTNAGIGESSGQLTIDLNDLSSATVAVASDSIAIIDADDNTTKKESIADLISGIAGTVTDTGLAASSGILSLDITNQTAVGTISTSDEIIIYDVDASAFKKATVNELQAGSAAPPAAQYVVLSPDATLSGERVLTPGDGLDLTDAGAGNTVTLDVDVTDIIDTSYGLKEASNNIQVALKSGAGLTFDSGEIKVDYGPTSGLAAEGSNQVNILAGDGLKTGGSFSIGASTSTIQLDIKPSDFAGLGLKVNSDDLDVYLGAGDNITITTGSDGEIVITGTAPAESIYTAGDGLDLTGQEFSVDLKSSGGLKIDATELAVEIDDFIGNGLENDGSDNIRVKPNTVQGTGYAEVHVNANGVSVRYDNVTIGDAGSGVLEVKDGAITSDKLQDNSVTIVAGDGLRNGGEVELGDSVTLNIAPSDFAGVGLSADGFFNLNIDDSIVATLSGSVFSGHVGVTGSIHSTAEISGSIVKALKLSGSLTTLENGTPYLLAGSGISLSTGSSGQITITGNVGDITGVTAGNGLSGGGDTGDVSLSVDDSIVATLTGSVFSGHVGVTGSIHSTSEISGSIIKASKLSGSLTTLENGNPYLLAGSGISLATGSDGSVTITGNVGDITGVTAGIGLSGGGDTGNVTIDVDDSVVATLTSSVKFSNGISGSLTRLSDGSSYLIAGSNINISSASNGAITISSVDTSTEYTAGTGLNLEGAEFSIDNSVVATLTGSVFSGHVGVTGSIHATAEISGSILKSPAVSGSLTRLEDGSPYLIAGSNITIISQSNGSVLISAQDDDTLYTAGNGLNLTAGVFSIDDSIVATLTGSAFSGIVTAPAFSGSLTQLEDGTSYIIAGDNVTVTSASNGSITIAADSQVTSPASPVGSVQFNDSGIFGGDSDFVYDNLNNVLTLSGTVQQLTASIFSTGYSGSVNLVTQPDFDSDITFILPQNVGEKFQFLQTDGTGSLSFDYADRVRIQVRNNSGYDLDAGTPIYITGYNAGGDIAYIAASSASLDSTMPAAAILAEDLLNNSNGHAALIGFLEGVDTSTFGVGNTLYVAADGGLTDSKPLGADVLIQNVGFVLKAANNGIMYVTSPGRTNDVPNDLVGRAGLSGSLQTLANGDPYLVAGSNITITTQSDGSVLISAQDDDTLYTAGTGLDLTAGVFSIDDSVVATLTGSVFSGTVVAPAFSGSLTHLEDGSSYLVAGSNVTITTGSNGAVTISSTGGGGGGSITATSGSTSIASMSTIRFGPGLIMNEDSSGVASVTASIGEAEDGTYADGLFTDFTPQTHIGTAVDRFNEILAALSPSPAPALDNISEAVTNGITAFLSFGASSDQTSETPAYPSVLDSAGIGDEVDVNESYSATVSGNNIRLGIYSGAQNIEGVLNEDVPSNSQGGGYVNYPANSFGDGDTGILKLEVNGSVVKEIDLTVETGAGSSGAGTADYINGNGSGFLNISEATEGTFSNGNSFQTFKHRTGEYIVTAADQRNGWNYLRIQHVKTGSTTTTNYVEWVNDNNSDALTAAGNSLEFEGSGSIHLSGVEYFRSGSLTYRNRVSNAYKYIYDTTNITFSTSNSATYSSGQTFNFVAQTKPTIDTAGGEDHTKQLHLTSSSDIDASYFINGTVTVGTNVTHPLKSNLSNGGQATASQILMYDLSNTSTNLIETFRRENYRIVSGSYDTQADVTDIANVWDSEVYMTSSNGGHSNGLQFFNQQLLSPINTISSGDFTGFSNGPSENPDYSGETGTRTFYRWFRNTTGSDQFDFSVSLQGSGTIVSHGTSLGTSTISVLVKLPGKTGWMDIAGTFVLDSVADNDGASAETTVISKDLTLNATNYVNFGNVIIENNEYVLVCIKADESWTGNISNITVDIGAGTGTLTPVPDLDDIDCDQDGTDANLSFGSAKSITGLADPTAAAGFTAADLNDLYQTAENSNNLRRSIFNGASTLEGDLNEDVSSPGNDYVSNAFSDANSGSLQLEVNGVVIHEVEITGSTTLVGTGNPGSGTGTSLNSDGSGFISLSNWGPGLFDNGVPRYSEIQRTAKYRIVSSSQRDGWNYARVLHNGTWGSRTTNYIEWIVDANNDAMASAGNGLTIFGDNTHSYLSGVKYFNSPSGSILTRVSNIYKNVYSDSSSAISFTSLSNATASRLVQSGSGLSSTKTTNSSTDSLQTLSTVTDSQNELLHVSGTINFTRSKSLPGTYTTAYSCGGALVFDHPFKTNLTIPTQTTTNLLVWTPSDTSNANTDEYFTGEAYRLVSGSYTAQADVSGGTKDWDSQISMDDNATYPEHATGLLIYDTYLIAPKDAGDNGDFRNHDEGGSIESPAGNVNYSSLTNSDRDYFRSFLNNTTNDRPSVQVTIYGDANIVGRTGANSGTLGSNKNIFVEIGIPGKTGLLDLGKPSAGSGNYNEGDGCLSGDLDATVDSGGATNTATFNGRTVDGTVSGAEYLVIRISASENWTGYLDRISVGWS